MKSKETCPLSRVECGSSADGTISFVKLPVDFTGLFSVPVKLVFQSCNILVMTMSPPNPQYKMSFLLLTSCTTGSFAFSINKLFLKCTSYRKVWW